ncbi:MAG: ribose transport system permease protein, partial [Frankiales bacterium]|nr:ribose transport system permease protein [Frankiales bacterium]
MTVESGVGHGAGSEPTTAPPAETPVTLTRHADKQASGLRLLAGAHLQRFGLPIVWLLVAATFAIVEPTVFLTSGTFGTVFGSQSVLLVISLALLVPFSAGEFDLSVAGVLSVTLVLIGFLNVKQGWPIVPTLLVAVAAGTLVGIVNAILVVGVGLDSMVVTLGMGTILLGAGVGINNETTAGLSPGLVNAVSTNYFTLPLSFLYGVILTGLMWYVFSYTPLGRYLYFVGSGRDVARLSGISVSKIRAGSLIVSAAITSLGGVILAGTLGAADPNVGSSYLLPAFAAAFLGSTAITPGRFNPWGTFIAVYFLVTGVTGLNLLGLTGWIEQLFYGTSLIVAITF